MGFPWAFVSLTLIRSLGGDSPSERAHLVFVGRYMVVGFVASSDPSLTALIGRREMNLICLLGWQQVSSYGWLFESFLLSKEGSMKWKDAIKGFIIVGQFVLTSCQSESQLHHGSDQKCCTHQEAKCLACQNNETVEIFCQSHPESPGCPVQGTFCCLAMTASCLACAQGISVEQFCQQNPSTTDCPSQQK